MEAVIEANDLTKRYGENTHAVDGLDLTVQRGEVYGFLGPNGAGKSTTIDMLLGVIEPTSGSAQVLGSDIGTESLSIRRSTGVLPGEFGLYDRHTAGEHVQFALDCKDAEGTPERILERVGLDDAADRQTKGFSTGMKRRLALAMALAGDPELLILDEPTRGLDPNGARRVREIVGAEVDEETTVFFSSHSMEQVEAVCDRIGVLRDGQLIAEDEVGTLMSQLTGNDIVVSVGSVPDGLVETVKSVDAVSGVRVEGTEVTVSVDDVGSKAGVIDAVESSGATVLNISSERGSLEDFFASVTVDEAENGRGTTAEAPEGRA